MFAQTWNCLYCDAEFVPDDDSGDNPAEVFLCMACRQRVGNLIAEYGGDEACGRLVQEPRRRTKSRRGNP